MRWVQFFESGFGAYEELGFVAIDFEGIEGKPCFYCRDAGFEMGEGRILSGFGGDVDLGVVSVAVEVQVDVADDVTEGEEVADERRGRGLSPEGPPA